MEKANQILAQLGLQKKLSVLKYAEEWKSVNKTLKLFKIPKSTYYKWKKAYDANGENGLLRKHPVAYNHPNKISEPIIEKILGLRKEHQLGSWRIKWYLERYHDIQISESSVYRILKRYGVERLHKKAARRSLHSKRYNKNTPGHHVQVDVKVALLKDVDGKSVKRFNKAANLIAISMVVSSRDSRMPPRRPSIIGRIPIFGYFILRFFIQMSLEPIFYLFTSQDYTFFSTLLYKLQNTFYNKKKES